MGDGEGVGDGGGGGALRTRTVEAEVVGGLTPLPTFDAAADDIGDLGKRLRMLLAASEPMWRPADRERILATVLLRVDERRRRHWQARWAAAGVVVLALLASGASLAWRRIH